MDRLSPLSECFVELCEVERYRRKYLKNKDNLPTGLEELKGLDVVRQTKIFLLDDRLNTAARRFAEAVRESEKDLE